MRILPPVLVGGLCLAFVVAGSNGAPGQAKSQSRASNDPVPPKAAVARSDCNPGGACGPGEVRDLQPGEKFIPGVGAHWLAAPAGTTPRVGARAAKSAASRGGGLTFGREPSSVALSIFGNDVRGTIRPDGSVKPDHENVLAWVLIYPDTPVIYLGPGTPAPGATAPSYVVVDAGTGQVLETWQGGILEVG